MAAGGPSLVEEPVTADEAIALISKAKAVVEGDMGVKVCVCVCVCVCVIYAATFYKPCTVVASNVSATAHAAQSGVEMADSSCISGCWMCRVIRKHRNRVMVVQLTSKCRQEEMRLATF